LAQIEIGMILLAGYIMKNEESSYDKATDLLISIMLIIGTGSFLSFFVYQSFAALKKSRSQKKKDKQAEKVLQQRVVKRKIDPRMQGITMVRNPIAQLTAAVMDDGAMADVEFYENPLKAKRVAKTEEKVDEMVDEEQTLKADIIHEVVVDEDEKRIVRGAIRRDFAPKQLNRKDLFEQDEDI
jgi:hypothetical protein